ncbi:ABC transporter ATP-binding protein [Actinoplanes hulinensis]|nr:ABC transporter ATP-binding protein [Actinoplanes hulinensis]
MIRTLLRAGGAAYAVPIALMTAAAFLEGLLYALIVPILKDPAAAWPWLAGLAAAVAGLGVLRYAADLSGMRVGTTLLRGMYHRLGDHLARLPLGWYDKARVGEVSGLASRGLLAALGVSAHLLGPFIAACVTPLTIVVVITAYDWRLGLAALAAAPLVLLAVRKRPAADGHAEVSDEAAARVVEFLQAQPVLRAGGRTGERFALLDDTLRDLERASRRRALSVLPGAVGMAFTVQTAFTAVLALGAYLALGGHLGTAELLAILVLAARAADPLLSLTDIGGKLRAARTELERLDRVLRTAPLPEVGHPVRPDRDDLEFDGVSFRGLTGLSLSVPQGQRLAVVGPSGAGKTTLFQLIARFHDVGDGTVRVGGVDVRDIAPDELMSRIAIVFQDTYLFDGTIEDNVRLGRPEATDAEVRAVLTAARLPSGWDTTVGEGGARLSGGERQRVSIARALLKDAPIVLLDEVTSALDPENEAAVHDGIERLMAGRTVVMVAHRMGTVRRADRIVFLDEGRIVEDGTHEELLALGGRYAEFCGVTPANR